MSDIPSSERFEPAGADEKTGDKTRAESRVAASSGGHALSDTAAFCAAWLSSLCAATAELRSGVLLLLQDAGGFVRIASWPTADIDVEALTSVLKASAQSKITEKEDASAGYGVSSSVRVGFPITILDTVHALVGLCFVQRDRGAGMEHQLQIVATHAVSLREFLQRGVIAGMQARMDQTLLAAKLVAGIVEADSFQYRCHGARERGFRSLRLRPRVRRRVR